MRFPNTAMGISLGLGGQAVLWQAWASTPFGAAIRARVLHRFFWTVGLGVWLAVLATLIVKGARYPGLVALEWRHRVRVYFWCARPPFAGRPLRLHQDVAPQSAMRQG